MSTCLLGLPLLFTPPLLASERQHGAHVHGRAELNLVLDGRSLLIELNSPAANLLGFEQAPRTPEQRTQLEQTLNTLRDGRRLFAFSPAAACQLEQVELESPLLADADEPHHKGHDHAQADHAEAGHADIIARYAYSCSQPQRLELRLFAEFPAIELLHSQLVINGRQQQLELSAEQTGIGF
ncbi:MAG: DUF2796 domain-containing protein [Gammaproteobacteria bacterium]|nr:DUF2796 domain-containing protein [Gammaproteobacteria bacterium]